MLRTGGTDEFLRMMDETQFERYWLVIKPMTFRSAMIPLIAAEVSPNPTGSTVIRVRCLNVTPASGRTGSRTARRVQTSNGRTSLVEG